MHCITNIVTVDHNLNYGENVNSGQTAMPNNREVLCNEACSDVQITWLTIKTETSVLK